MANGDTYQHGTVSGSVVDVVVAAGASRVRVINRSGGAEIAATTNAATPSLTGNNPIVPAGIGAYVDLDMQNAGTTVKLISTATGTTYSVWVL